MGRIQGGTGRPGVITINSYLTVGCGGGQAPFTPESVAQQRVRTPGTYSNLLTTITASPSATVTIKFMKNGVAGNQAISILSSTTGIVEDTVDKDNVVVTDLVEISNTGSGTSANGDGISTAFTGLGGVTCMRHVCQGTVVAAFAGTSTTYLSTLAGTLAAGALTDANTQFLFRASGTFKNGHVIVTVNSWGTAVTAGTRIGGTPGNVAISITASQTGIFEDITDSDKVSSGNLVNVYVATPSGSGSVTISTMAFEFFPAGNAFQIIMGTNSPSTIAANGTVYQPICGRFSSSALAESSQNLPNRILGVFSNLMTHISTNTVTAASTLTFRVATGTSGNQSVSIGNSATGWFEDTTHAPDQPAYGATTCLQLITGATGTSLAMDIVGMLCTLVGRELAASGAGN